MVKLLKTDVKYEIDIETHQAHYVEVDKLKKDLQELQSRLDAIEQSEPKHNKHSNSFLAGLLLTAAFEIEALLYQLEPNWREIEHENADAKDVVKQIEEVLKDSK